MEATGVYWKPVVGDPRGRVRADAGQRPARQAGPGPQDRRLRRGVAVPARRRRGCCRRASCRPSRSATLRNLTRYRKTQIAGARSARPTGCTRRSRTPASSSTASPADILGKSGRAMLDALVAGTTDPDVLAELARGKLRKKMPALREALEGRFDAHARAVDRRDPRAHRLPRRADRAALGRDRGADRPFRARPLSCCARSPASSAAPPRRSSPRSAPT